MKIKQLFCGKVIILSKFGSCPILKRLFSQKF